MCNIAGYIGAKRAAPVLIDMMKREEGFDAGYYTGIATIDNGKLYYAKLTGDTDRLTELTEALNLPGNIGIIHGRTKSGGGDLWAHPFIAKRNDEPYLAYVANGAAGFFASLNEMREQKANELLKDGYDMSSKEFVPTKKYLTLSNGMSVHSSDVCANYAMRNLDRGMELKDALEDALCNIPDEDVVLGIALSNPDAIAYTRINQPMVVSYAEHGVYMASTAMAFPDDAGLIKTLPVLSSGYIYKDRIVSYPYKKPPCVVTDIDENIRNKSYNLVIDELKKEKQTINSLRRSVKSLFGKIESAPTSYLVYEIIRSLKLKGILNMETVRVEGVYEGITAPEIRMWINKI